MNGKVITAVVVVTLAATSSYAAAQLPTQFSEKQLEKRAKKLAKLSPQHFTKTAKLQDDDLETVATITTSDGFTWRGGFTSRVSVIKPKVVLIIGSSRQLDNDKKQTDFRILRNSLKNIEVILYDELLQKIEQIAEGRVHQTT